MIPADYHTHSRYSCDSNTPLTHLIDAAVAKGLSEIAVTDHVDMDYPPVEYYHIDEFDYEARITELNKLARKYDNIRIVHGVEMGLQKKISKKIEGYFCGKQFDFVIGSTHIVDFKDLYDGTFFIGKTREEAITEYFLDVLDSIKSFDIYHVYGHLDCIARYGSAAERPLEYMEFREIIDEILISLIRKGKGIELNSSGLRYGFTAPHPGFEILKRYRELGGEIITAGSDAHRAQDVASHFGELCEMLKAAGFRAVTTFSGGIPSFADI